MKLIINTTNIVVSGGVQVSLSFIDEVLLSCEKDSND